MHVIILAGGPGTRLQGTFPDLPKALAPVRGKPILQRQLEYLATQGMDNIHVSAGYKADRIEEWLHSYPEGASVRVHIENKPLGTGGGIEFTSRNLNADHYLVLNGDTLVPDLSLNDMIDDWKSRPLDVLLAATAIEKADRYGSLDINEQQLITAFREKDARNNGIVNAGVYILSQNAINSITPDTFVSLENDIFPSLCEQRRIGAFMCDSPMLDMGTPEGLNAMESWADAHD